MTDNVSKRKRSEIMRAIKSKWTTPEVKLHEHLKARHVKHKMHPKIKVSVQGVDARIEADAIVGKTVVFVHGCFWHSCEEHKYVPKDKGGYWATKLENNRQRDIVQRRTLELAGYRVVEIWEHDIENKRWDDIVRQVKGVKETWQEYASKLSRSQSRKGRAQKKSKCSRRSSRTSSRTSRASPRRSASR